MHVRDIPLVLKLRRRASIYLHLDKDSIPSKHTDLASLNTFFQLLKDRRHNTEFVDCLIRSINSKVGSGWHNTFRVPTPAAPQAPPLTSASSSRSHIQPQPATAASLLSAPTTPDISKRRSARRSTAYAFSPSSHYDYNNTSYLIITYSIYFNRQI